MGFKSDKYSFKHQNEARNIRLDTAETTNLLHDENPLTEHKELSPSDPDYLEKLYSLPIQLQQEHYKKQQEQKFESFEEKKAYEKRVLMAALVFFIGLFSLWVPLYRTICEHTGLTIKTKQTDFKEQTQPTGLLGKLHKAKPVDVTRKFKVKFIDEVDVELPWEFKAQQSEVTVNAGETCLIFYKARNKTDQPIVGISIYDLAPQPLALYFNKVQCFCFENQMLGPYEEVDFPVLFYIDPAVEDDSMVRNYGYDEMVLKYTFYYAKNQDLAKIMSKHLQKEKKNEEILNERKRLLNEQLGYDKYEITEDFKTLPGVNPVLREYKIAEGN